MIRISITDQLLNKSKYTGEQITPSRVFLYIWFLDWQSLSWCLWLGRCRTSPQNWPIKGAGDSVGKFYSLITAAQITVKVIMILMWFCYSDTIWILNFKCRIWLLYQYRTERWGWNWFCNPGLQSATKSSELGCSGKTEMVFHWIIERYRGMCYYAVSLR